ncbi:hypothetical protein L2719_05370 [Shewanella schlegeliana]|uniref:DUF1186 domain-containing protein n=1 Tax=Shewanella schlegeliana TaxID=190308 RepID=A0ABS1SWK9_9GAMM|nr:hypothetical protein [Shewanella schlegeliana]MBL4912926.1 hypothetical protein [Shewanella schlegeliana]MCL1108978.1 hypothetical protein [Shewanella schlegeliana]GIU23471.1 hypothetical protein TUM4433_05970 [Shewanella schlegeliana]
MSIRGMNELKQYIAANDFEWLKANDAASKFDSIYEDEQGIAIIDKLRAAGVFSDEDIFLQLYCDKEHHMHDWHHQQWLGKTAALFDILERYPRDGSLTIADAPVGPYYELVYELSNDFFLPMIKRLRELGFELDHNAFLEHVYDGNDDPEYELYEFLIGHYQTFSRQALATTCAAILSHEPDETELEDKNQQIINTLLAKGADLDARVNDNSCAADYGSLFIAFFALAPELLKSHPLIAKNYLPSEQAVEEINWEYVVLENDFGPTHLAVLTNLVAKGAELPLDEIAESLEEIWHYLTEKVVEHDSPSAAEHLRKFDLMAYARDVRAMTA